MSSGRRAFGDGIKEYSKLSWLRPALLTANTVKLSESESQWRQVPMCVISKHRRNNKIRKKTSSLSKYNLDREQDMHNSPAQCSFWLFLCKMDQYFCESNFVWSTLTRFVLVLMFSLKNVTQSVLHCAGPKFSCFFLFSDQWQQTPNKHVHQLPLCGSLEAEENKTLFLWEPITGAVFRDYVEGMGDYHHHSVLQNTNIREDLHSRSQPPFI